MTRKDYNAISKLIAGETVKDIAEIPAAYHQSEGVLWKYRLVCKLADYLETDNANFDRDRFFTACYA